MPSLRELTSAALSTKSVGTSGDREKQPNLGVTGGYAEKRLANKNAARHTEAYGGEDAIDWVMTCVDLYAQSASSAGFHFERGETELKRPPGDLENLLKRPNPYTDWTEMIELAVIDFLLTGEFIWLKFAMRKDGKPLSLYRLPPSLVKVIPKANGLGPKEYEYTAKGGQPVRFPAEEILHVKRPNPHDPYRGLGIIAGGPRAADIDLAVVDQTASYFEQATRLSGVLESDRGVPDSTFQKLKAQFRSLYAGTKNAGAVATLERGLKFRAISANAAEANLVEVAKWSRERIAAAFKVPLPLIGDVQSMDRHAVREGKRIFDNDVMKPFLDRIASQISHGLTQAWGLDICFDYEYEMPVEDKLDLAEALASLPGVTVAQVLAFVDIDPTGDPEIDDLVLNLPGKSTDPETEKQNGPGHADKPLGSEGGRPPRPENTVAVPRNGKLPPTADAVHLKKALDERLETLRGAVNG